MAKSIMPYNIKSRCYACGANCETDEHHIFQGSNRADSDKYGLTVYLCRVCHRRAHEHPIEFESTYHLKRLAQMSAMSVYHWTVDKWRKLFRKDYR